MPEKLKKGWRYWRFEQVAVMVNDRIDDPSKAEVDRYVGLEHLDSDSLTIRRWGSPSDVAATKLIFRAGDIIFGRRRAYQRKLALADFDGICSAHAMVLRSRPEVALPEFLPFFMQSDIFMERAKGISVGSLSPTINWKTLAKEEFALPPLEEQRRIAEVLQAAEQTKRMYDNLSNHAVTLLESINRSVFTNSPVLVPLSKYSDVNPETLNSEQLRSQEVWKYIDLSSVDFPQGIIGMEQIRLCDAPSRARRIIQMNDILVSTVRPNLRGHTIVKLSEKRLVASTGFAVLRLLEPSFRAAILGMILSDRFLQHCQEHVIGTAYPAVSSTAIANFKVPDLSKMKELRNGEIYQKAIDAVEYCWFRSAHMKNNFMPDLLSRLIT